MIRDFAVAGTVLLFVSEFAACSGDKREAPVKLCENVLDLVDPASGADAGDSCPVTSESTVGKIVDPGQLFGSDVTRAHRASVRLRPMPGVVPSCPLGDSPAATCDERDVALLARHRANLAQVACVLTVFGMDATATPMGALWYEGPYKLSGSHVPVPIGVEFEVLALLSTIQRLAAHPYVERVSPAPGFGPSDSEPRCPDMPFADDPTPKVVEARATIGKGRKPVVVELGTGATPTAESHVANRCNSALATAWADTIASTQRMTCVKRWISANLETATQEGSYGARTLLGNQPPLPPFSQLASTSNVIALSLDWDEAVGIASHPYVTRIWTSESLQSAPSPSNCVPSEQPSQSRECPTIQESPDMKWSNQDKVYWEASQGTNDVLITVRGGATICQLPPCPEGSEQCAERKRLIDSWIAENSSAQRCVRTVIDEIGGTSEPEALWLINAFQAYLSWSQIERIASHPDVQRIERSSTGAPKP